MRKNTWLLLASLVFYSFGQVYYLPLLLLSVALNYVCGRLAAGKYAKLGVTLAVLGGIGCSPCSSTRILLSAQ